MNVLVHRGFRFRLYPTAAQCARLVAWEHALRFLWNLALEQRRMCMSRSKCDRVFLRAFDQINDLTELRAAAPWIADLPRGIGDQVMLDLDRAWQRCFERKAGAPRFRKRGDSLGMKAPNPRQFRLVGSTLRFPKLGSVRAVVHRPLEGKLKTCTIKRDGDQWFASIVCEIELPDPTLRHEPVVALDRGVVNLVADSDSVIVESPRFYARSMKRLAHAQRVVARRKKGSKNRAKAVARVARLRRKIRRQREHVVQSLSAAYAKSHGTVVVEDLNIRNMVRKGLGKRGLNRSILDAGWGRLAECLRYKLAASGGQLVEEVAAYSSQTCSVCGHVDSKS